MNIIKLSDETKNYMKVITEQMESIGVLSDADRENLDLMASQVELYRRAMKELDESGMCIYDMKGRAVAHPAFSIARSCMTQIVALMRELSISARQRRMLVKDDMVEDTTPMDEFFADVTSKLY